MTKPTNKIEHFDGVYKFLSNFEPAHVIYEGARYDTAEHAYQAAKTTDENLRKQFYAGKISPSYAKRLGQKLPLRPDWEQIKLSVMHEIVRFKFTHNPIMRQNLLATGNAELIEGNWWGDTFWGVCKGVGENHLGKILMDVRTELRANV
jgi:ribA/ribD-fused uncharacterized protein